MQVPLILPYNALMRAFRARRDTPVRGSHSSPAALPSESTQQVFLSGTSHKVPRLSSSTDSDGLGLSFAGVGIAPKQGAPAAWHVHSLQLICKGSCFNM